MTEKIELVESSGVELCVTIVNHSEKPVQEHALELQTIPQVRERGNEHCSHPLGQQTIQLAKAWSCFQTRDCKCCRRNANTPGVQMLSLTWSALTIAKRQATAPIQKKRNLKIISGLRRKQFVR
jgi:hypothetical protein